MAVGSDIGFTGRANPEVDTIAPRLGYLFNSRYSFIGKSGEELPDSICNLLHRHKNRVNFIPEEVLYLLQERLVLVINCNPAPILTSCLPNRFSSSV
jgi:hypothetical protein